MDTILTFLLESLQQYYGLDWIAMISSFLSVYLLGNRYRLGFVFGVIGALSWLLFNSLVDSLPGVVSNLVLIGLHIRGYMRWQHGKPDETPTPPA